MAFAEEKKCIEHKKQKQENTSLNSTTLFLVDKSILCTVCSFKALKSYFFHANKIGLCVLWKRESTILVNSYSLYFTGIIHIQVKTCEGELSHSVHSPKTKHMHRLSVTIRMY